MNRNHSLDAPAPTRAIESSLNLSNVHYEIRGPVLEEAHQMTDRGEEVLKLNIGNPAQFGFTSPPELRADISNHLMEAEAYCDSLGLQSAREAIRDHVTSQGISGVGIEHIFTGNGVSELIMMSLEGLLGVGDEVLIPAPDYPLWTAAANLSGATPVHYHCDEQSGWNPDISDIRSKVSDRTKAIVIINPNNPTGAVYSKDLLEQIVGVAREHGLVVFCDEIYDTIVYDKAVHHPIAALSDDVLFVTFCGLSKSHRAAGFRSGWMTLSGAVDRANDYISALTTLASMRLCANVPTQHAIAGALSRRQTIDDFVAPGGRLREQRDHAWKGLNAIDGISCVKPEGALYLFPKIDAKRFNITDDRQFILDFLRAERILMVQGTGFNWSDPDHFRIVFLAEVAQLDWAFERLASFLDGYQQSC